MSAALKKWLVMNVVCNMIFVYVGIFINLFIWEKNHLISEVAFFNLFVYISWTFSFAFATHILAKTTVRLLLGTSAFSGTSAFVILSTLQLDNRMLFIAMIGVTVGIMYAFYGAAHHMSVSLSGKSGELGLYFSASGTIQQVVTLVVPLMSAAIILQFGYAGTFALMLVFLLFMLGFSFAMPKFSLRTAVADESEKPTNRWLLQELLRKPGLRWFSASSLAAGVFLQFQQMFLLIFTFSVTENKLLIAALSALYTTATFGGLLAYRRLKLKDNTLLFIGCTLLACGFLIVLFPAKPILIVSNLLTAVGMFCFLAAWNTLQFKWVKPYSAARQAKLLVWREVLICTTRIGMLLIVMSLDDLRGPLFTVLIALSLLCLLSVPFFEFRAKKCWIKARV